MLVYGILTIILNNVRAYAKYTYVTKPPNVTKSL